MNKRKNYDSLPLPQAPALRCRQPENAGDELYHNEHVVSLALLVILKRANKKTANAVDVQLSKLEQQKYSGYFNRASLLKKVMVTSKLKSSFDLFDSTMPQISLMKEELVKATQPFLKLGICVNATLHQLPCIGVKQIKSREEEEKVREGFKKLRTSLIELETFAEAAVDVLKKISVSEKSCEKTKQSLRQIRADASQVAIKSLSSFDFCD